MVNGCFDQEFLYEVQVLQISYDGNDNRVMKTDVEGYQAGMERRTFYVGEGYEKQYTGVPDYEGEPPLPPVGNMDRLYLPLIWQNHSNGMELKYYFVAGKRVTVRINGELSWLYGDQLGSVSAVVKADGTLISKSLYYPWGSERLTQGTSPTDYGYTGQKREGDIYYYNARWYDPQLGRFMQADTIVPTQQGTQGFDRYAYVNNNPVNGTDPSGHAGIRDYTMTMTDGGTNYYWETRIINYDIEGALSYASKRTLKEYETHPMWGNVPGTKCVIFAMDSMINEDGGGLKLYDKFGNQIIPSGINDSRFYWTTDAGNLLRIQPGAHYQEVNLAKGETFSSSQFMPGDFVIINQENNKVPWGHAVLVESVDIANNTVTIIEMGNPYVDFDFNRRDFFDVKNTILGYRIYRIPEYLP